MARMTRRKAVGLALATVLVIGGALAWVLTRPDTSPAPATKKALAAVVVDVLAIEPSSYNVNPLYEVPEPLGVEMRWHPGGSDDAHLIRVRIRGDDRPADYTCKGYTECDDWAASGDADGGHFYLRWQEEAPESDPGIVTLTLLTADGETRSVTYAGAKINGDPREEEDLPISIEQFERLVTDPRFASTTTQEMVDADLDKWPADDDAGDAVPTTPLVVAQWMRQDGVRTARTEVVPADTERYGAGAVGATYRSPGHTATVVLVPQGSAQAPTCESGWHCQTKRGVTTGWRPGVAIVIRKSANAVVYSEIRSDAIVDGLPRPAWRFGQAGRDYESMVRSFAAMNLQTTKAFAEGVDVPRFQRG